MMMLRLSMVIATAILAFVCCGRQTASATDDPHYKNPRASTNLFGHSHHNKDGIAGNVFALGFGECEIDDSGLQTGCGVSTVCCNQGGTQEEDLICQPNVDSCGGGKVEASVCQDPTILGENCYDIGKVCCKVINDDEAAAENNVFKCLDIHECATSYQSSTSMPNAPHISSNTKNEDVNAHGKPVVTICHQSTLSSYITMTILEKKKTIYMKRHPNDKLGSCSDHCQDLCPSMHSTLGGNCACLDGGFPKPTLKPTTSTPRPTQNKKNKKRKRRKVAICHMENPSNFITITVRKARKDRHMRNNPNDVIGTCADHCEGLCPYDHSISGSHCHCLNNSTSPPTLSPTIAKCFVDREELVFAVNAYMSQGCSSSSSPPSCVVTKVYGPIRNWCTKDVTDMSSVLSGWTNSDLSTFNEDISAWDVSSAIDMRFMFLNASAFNQDLSTWNTSQVNDFGYMFQDASSFNNDVSTWDVSSATSMKLMFYGASAFNQDLSTWKTSKVQNFLRMFQNASSFNKDVSHWDVSSATDMRFMFQGASAFNQSLCSWGESDSLHHQISTSTDFFVVGGMFLYSGCPNTNDPVALGGPYCHTCNQCFEDKGELVDVLDAYMSQGCSSSSSQQSCVVTGVHGPIRNWCTKDVTDMSELFIASQNAALDSFNEDISGWNVGKVTTMVGMFYGASAFNQDLSTWNTSQVNDFEYMFQRATSFNNDVSTWDVSSATSMKLMFSYASAFNQDLSTWNTSQVIDFTGMFVDATSFNGVLSNWNVSSAISIDGMFQGASAFNQNLCGWSSNVPSSASVSLMFYDSGCPNTNDTVVANGGPYCYTC